MNNLDLLTTNSENTLDKTLNCVINLYATYQNKTVTVDYGDGQIQNISLNGRN